MSSISSISSNFAIGALKKEDNKQAQAADAIFEIAEQTPKKAAGIQINQNSSDAAYQAQVYGQEEAKTDVSELEGKKPSAAEEFLEYIKMTPAERIREQVLKEEGLTEEEFAALPPEKKAAIENKIKERIEMALNQGTGVDSGAKEAVMKYNYLSMGALASGAVQNSDASSRVLDV